MPPRGFPSSTTSISIDTANTKTFGHTHLKYIEPETKQEDDTAESHAVPSDVSHLSPSALLAVAVDEQSQDFPHEHCNPASNTYIQLISASPANVTTMYMLVNAAERVLLERIFREEAMKKYVNEDGKPNELAQLAQTLKFTQRSYSDDPGHLRCRYTLGVSPQHEINFDFYGEGDLENGDSYAAHWHDEQDKSYEVKLPPPQEIRLTWQRIAKQLGLTPATPLQELATFIESITECDYCVTMGDWHVPEEGKEGNHNKAKQMKKRKRKS